MLSPAGIDDTSSHAWVTSLIAFTKRSLSTNLIPSIFKNLLFVLKQRPFIGQLPECGKFIGRHQWLCLSEAILSAKALTLVGLFKEAIAVGKGDARWQVKGHERNPFCLANYILTYELHVHTQYTVSSQ